MRHAASRLQGEVVVTSHVLLNILTAATIILIALLCITAAAIRVPVVVRAPAMALQISDGKARTQHLRDAPRKQLIGLQVDARKAAVLRPGQSIELRQRVGEAWWSGQIDHVLARSVARRGSLAQIVPLPAKILLRTKVDRFFGASAVIPAGASLTATVEVGRQTPFEWLRRAVNGGK